jgi:hypothetical protein
LNGFAATVRPIARSASGLPVSVLIIGGYLEDRTPISFAGLVVSVHEFPVVRCCGSSAGEVPGAQLRRD